MSPFFRGTYEHALDAKGRVAVPKKFREGLLGVRDDYTGAELLVTFGLSGQLFIYSSEAFDDFSERYSALEGDDADLLDRFFGANARECGIDAQGRILIPPSMKKFAGLEKDVVWVGQRGHVELWSAARWAEALDMVQQGIYQATSQRLKDAYSKIRFQ